MCKQIDVTSYGRGTSPKGLHFSLVNKETERDG